jgi:hypothetical protein
VLRIALEKNWQWAPQGRQEAKKRTQRARELRGTRRMRRQHWSRYSAKLRRRSICLISTLSLFGLELFHLLAHVDESKGAANFFTRDDLIAVRGRDFHLFDQIQASASEGGDDTGKVKMPTWLAFVEKECDPATSSKKEKGQKHVRGLLSTLMVWLLPLYVTSVPDFSN